ncbi:3'-phosphoadenosine 5'-phosphosulfate sulfotransferase [Paenibacillus rhizosphaerae]|uniref:3'-phosphoadenosine 5'-phosphosulfate sulfotransferase n=1 Tax=Paenibacillus rhizosphaerae TaxID=297318 RepID=A0A839TQ89_9BACL|nr:hypothetical protein [Paenibacillus rhizosphaerae]MBB3128683.1 3'-phosphoadenosine 5'-phosphosulfate sulfotransferase [Paenibacillus rhizosphaerae]
MKKRSYSSVLFLIIFAIIAVSCGKMPSDKEPELTTKVETQESFDIKSEKEILNIRLQCTVECKRMVKPPFKEKIFEDADEIKIFVKAINNSKKIEADLDYSTFFLMHITFKDDTEKVFVLNVNDAEGGVELLVKNPGSSEGYYSISEELHKELRTLIYHS